MSSSKLPETGTGATFICFNLLFSASVVTIQRKARVIIGYQIISTRAGAASASTCTGNLSYTTNRDKVIMAYPVLSSKRSFLTCVPTWYVCHYLCTSCRRYVGR